ncbi:MAG: EamA family transporter [Opitutaceae bacterium]|jgi:drug/metabolite transporter (DMT)-like permease
MNPSRSALLIAFATIYIVWGSTYLGIRIAVESIPPFLMASLRFLAAGALTLGFLRLRGPLCFKLHQVRDNAIVGVLLLMGGNGLISWAETSIPSGITSLLIGSQPLIMVLTEWAWKGGLKPNLITLGALVLGFAGVAWLAAPWESQAGGALPVGGVIAILVACISWAIGSIYSRHAHNPAPLFSGAGIQMLAGSAALAIVAAIRGEWSAWHPACVSLRSWLAVGYLTVVGSLVGFSAFVWLLKHSTPARVSTYAYVNPVVALFLGWLILHEPLGARTLVASAVIVAAVVIITVQKSRTSSA